MAWTDSNASPGALDTRQGLPKQEGASSQDPWLKLANDAYEKGVTYFENNYRKQMEDGLRAFNNQHPRDSKYNSDSYKYRSRIFRPKTRSVIRKHEATAAAAFFSNPDFLTLDPVNEDDDLQIASAGIMKELLHYRLASTKRGVHWFLTSLGAFQDAMTVGICASFQYWDYATREVEREVQGDLLGEPLTLKVKEEKPSIDKPCCELLAIENLIFDPGAKWYDVVGTSPYLILKMPMYVRDVLDRMETGYGRGEAPWKKLSKDDLLKARITEDSPVQQSRDGRREDPKTQTSTFNEFDMVMVHLNFIKTEEGCFTFYTLKDLEMLSEPKALEEVFLHGEIPVTVGFCVLETHKPFPQGLTGLGSQLQAEANEIVNQRLDNVKFVLNKRWIVRRGSQVDVESMLRNVPGGVTMASDVDKDIKELTWNDVTASAYQEQDRLNADFDDLEGGGLNPGSVMTNRKLNETVGGMRMLAQGGNAITEYTLRVFVETWVEPTLRQIIKLEQFYETDEVVLAIAAQKAGQLQRFQMSPDLDNLLQQELTLSVNVGMGATDPEARFQRFMQAMGAYSQMSMQAPPDSNLPEIRKELFGLAGFKDSKRFFTKVDPRWAQAQQLLQQAQSVAQQVVDGAKDRILRGQMQLERKAVDLDLRELSIAHKGDMLRLEQKNPQAEMALQAQKQVQDHSLKQHQQAFEFALRTREHHNEMAMEREKATHDAALERFQAQMKAAMEQFLMQAKVQTEQARAKSFKVLRDEKGKMSEIRSD